jgi:diguanylate cyclase (GGDEF)-like protein
LAKAYAVGSGVLMSVIIIAPSDRAVATAGVLTGVLAVSAMVWGIRRHRPPRQWIWWLLAVAVAFTSYPKGQQPGHLAVSGPIMLMSGLGNLGFVIAPLIMVKARGGRDRDETLDGWILTLALAVGLRQFLLAGQPDQALVPQPLVLILTVMAGITVAASIRLVFLARRTASAWLLLGGSVAGQLIGISLAMANSGITQSGLSADLLAGVSRLLIGAAALTSSMPSLTTEADRRGAAPHARVLLLGGALPVAVVGVFVEAGGQRVISFGGIGLMTIVVLLVARMARLVNQREGARKGQELVAELGNRALRDDNQHQFLNALCTSAVAYLNADYAAVILIDPADSRPVVSASAGPLADDPAGVALIDRITSERETPPNVTGETLSVPLAGVDGRIVVHRLRRRHPFSVDQRMCAAAIGVTASSALRRYRSEAQIRHASLHDALTGLPNRTMFLGALEDAIATGADSGVSVLFIDLDRFKSVNDTLGHHAGDELLVEVAQRITRLLPEEYRLARLAGDEFVVLCPDDDGSACQDIAAQVSTELARPFVLRAGVAEIGGSVGCATHNGVETAEQLIHRADIAMYGVKRAVSRQ